ncbi:unnamed protein product [Dibothriocephalus latus]|uniref:Uncharacterized protein n=1 Tax=Dibothriocephalus latus TaxID=60516 RepID=A0A3P7QS10_DIBLA|nr:unnamed protein product [Dibothriocephalus latus]
MWALGDKIASTILAQSAGIPTVPWSGSRKLSFCFFTVWLSSWIAPLPASSKCCPNEKLRVLSQCVHCRQSSRNM